MEYIFIIELTDKDRADNLVEYLNYSGITSKVEFNDESEAYRILVDKSKRSDAKKYMNAFFVVESEEKTEARETANEKNDDESVEDSQSESSDTDEYNWERNDDSEEVKTADSEAAKNENSEDNVEDDSSEEKNIKTESDTYYVPKAEKYENFKSSAWTFIVFGILGAIFLLLNVIGVLTIYSTVTSQIILGLIVLACFMVGLWCMKGISKLKDDAESEENFTETLNNWLLENITEEFITTHKLADASDEVNFIKISDAIKELINTNFGELDDAYLDSIIDNFYSENFENDEYDEYEEEEN